MPTLVLFEPLIDSSFEDKASQWSRLISSNEKRVIGISRLIYFYSLNYDFELRARFRDQFTTAKSRLIIGYGMLKLS